MNVAALAEVPAVDVEAEFPYDFAVVDVDRLMVDEEYQRPLTNFVNRIRKNFDPALVGCLVISARRRGKWAIIDGQTRWVAMTDLGFKRVPCVVFTGLTQAQEADLFGRLQKERRGVLSYHRFRSALVAKKPEALAINSIVQATGYTVGPQAKAGRMIPAVAALEQAYRRGPDVLERTLLVFKEAWREKWMFEGGHLKGMARYLHDNPHVDDERLARRLSIVSPDELKRRSTQLRDGRGMGGGSDKYMAEAIEGVYDHGKAPKAIAA